MQEVNLTLSKQEIIEYKNQYIEFLKKKDIEYAGLDPKSPLAEGYEALEDILCSVFMLSAPFGRIHNKEMKSFDFWLDCHYDTLKTIAGMPLNILHTVLNFNLLQLASLLDTYCSFLKMISSDDIDMQTQTQLTHLLCWGLINSLTKDIVTTLAMITNIAYAKNSEDINIEHIERMQGDIATLLEVVIPFKFATEEKVEVK